MPRGAAAVDRVVCPLFQHPVRQLAVAQMKPSGGEPLRVRMFTSDPDVVIYWIVDKKEGYE